MKTNTILSIKDTTVIKGIAILLIVTHNFLHWIKPMLGENEFGFNPIYSQNFLNSINNNPANFLQYLIAFAGHYGIYLFVFTSGYGLTKRYAGSHIKYKDFIKIRITKLYPVFTIALIGLFIYNYVIFNMNFDVDVAIDFLIRYSLIANLIPKEVFVLNGPFWFYSMIMQLYLLFPLLLIIKKKKTTYLYIISVFCVVLVFCFNPQLVALNFSLYYNFLPHLPIFILGIVYAFNDDNLNKQLQWLSIASIVVLFSSIYNIYFWYLSNVAFVILFLTAYLYFKKFKFPKLLMRFTLYTGSLSYYLFAVHGFLRKPWVGFANKANSEIFNYLYLLLFLIISFGVAIITRRIEQYYLTYKNKKTTTNTSL